MRLGRLEILLWLFWQLAVRPSAEIERACELYISPTSLPVGTQANAHIMHAHLHATIMLILVAGRRILTCTANLLLIASVHVRTWCTSVWVVSLGECRRFLPFGVLISGIRLLGTMSLDCRCADWTSEKCKSRVVRFRAMTLTLITADACSAQIEWWVSWLWDGKRK